MDSKGYTEKQMLTGVCILFPVATGHICLLLVMVQKNLDSEQINLSLKFFIIVLLELYFYCNSWQSIKLYGFFCTKVKYAYDLIEK